MQSNDANQEKRFTADKAMWESWNIFIYANWSDTKFSPKSKHKQLRHESQTLRCHGNILASGNLNNALRSKWTLLDHRWRLESFARSTCIFNFRIQEKSQEGTDA